MTTLPTYSATYVLRNQAARRSNMAITSSWIIEEWLVQDSLIQLSLFEVLAGSSGKISPPTASSGVHEVPGFFSWSVSTRVRRLFSTQFTVRVGQLCSVKLRH